MFSCEICPCAFCDELATFKKLAQAYGRMTEAELASALSQRDLLELSDDE